MSSDLPWLIGVFAYPRRPERRRSMSRADSRPEGLPRILVPRATTVSAPMTVEEGNDKAAVLALRAAAPTANRTGSVSPIEDSTTSTGWIWKSGRSRLISSWRRGEAEARTISIIPILPNFRKG